MTETEKALFVAARIMGMALWRLRTEIGAAKMSVPVNQVRSFAEAMDMADDANRKWVELQGDARIAEIANSTPSK